MRPVVLLLALLVFPVASASPSALEVDIAASEKWEKPQSVVVFPVTLTSPSDAPIEVVFKVVSTSGGLVAPLPRPLVVRGSATVPIAVNTPYHNGFVQETGAVAFEALARDPDTKAPVSGSEPFTLTVHTRGMYVPGPQLFMAMAAIGLAALFLRRRTIP